MEHPLRVYRKRNGVSLEDLAAKTGMSKSSLSRFENGLRTPSIDDVASILKATKNALKVEDFVGRRNA